MVLLSLLSQCIGMADETRGSVDDEGSRRIFALVGSTARIGKHVPNK